jgi:RNA polymerase sigma factor (sigma-70 family)
MGEAKKTPPPLWISKTDERNQPVEQRVIDAAHRIWHRVLGYVRASGQEAADAAEILETVTHSVSRTIRQKDEGDSVRNIDTYLYWSFVRKHTQEKSRERRIQYLGSLEPLESLQHDRLDGISWLDNEILLEELASYMDEKTRRLFVLRVLGYSWAEIGRKFGITAHNVEVQFSYGLKKARKRLLGNRPSDRPKSGSEREG